MTDSEWNSLSAAEKEAERERITEETREQFLDSNLCSDIPQAVFQGFIRQGSTNEGERHSASFIYEGSMKINLMSAAFAAKLDSKPAVEISIDTAKGPRTFTKSTTASVEFPGGGGLKDTAFRIIDGLKHDVVLGTCFKAEATMTISFSNSTIGFANQNPESSFKFEPTTGRH
jgi:hypothetical protein